MTWCTPPTSVWTAAVLRGNAFRSPFLWSYGPIHTPGSTCGHTAGAQGCPQSSPWVLGCEARAVARRTGGRKVLRMVHVSDSIPHVLASPEVLVLVLQTFQICHWKSFLWTSGTREGMWDLRGENSSEDVCDFVFANLIYSIPDSLPSRSRELLSQHTAWQPGRAKEKRRLNI